MDVVTEPLLERRDGARRDRRATRIDLGQARQGLLARVRSVHQRDEHRDRPHGERGALLLDGVDGVGRIHAVHQHQRCTGQQRQGDVADEPGDVEQRCDAEDDVVWTDVDPVPVGLRVERHVAVGGHRALRWAGGPGGVRQESDRVGADLGRRHGPATEGHEHLRHVRGARALDAFDTAEGAAVRTLVLEFRRRDHGAHGGRLDDLRCYIGVEGLQRDQDRGTGVAQDLLEFAFAVHRIGGHGDAAGLPRSELGDDELGHVLCIDRDPFTRPEPCVEDSGGECVAQFVEFTCGDPAVEVADDVGVRIAFDGRPEHRQRVVEFDRAWLPLRSVVLRQPHLVVIDGHGSPQRMTMGFTGAPVPLTIFSGAAV